MGLRRKRATIQPATCRRATRGRERHRRLRFQTELASAVKKGIHIFFVQRDYKIDVHRHPRDAVKVHGQPAREQVIHLVTMKRSKELEVEHVEV